jgi:TetR/AcrR family transcriptional repressor of nem operon
MALQAPRRSSTVNTPTNIEIFMGRARKVSRELARESALSAFWVHGYKGLGVRKLEELTGINRFALQTEYGGKTGLFGEILDAYTSAWDDGYLEPVRSGNLDDLAAYFLQRASKAARAEANSGCLMINTLSEGNLDAPQISERVSGFLDHIQSTFAQALHNERAQGSLISHLDIKAASQMLLSSMIGMNIFIRMKGNSEAALPTALGLQTTIMSWRTPAKS